MKLSGKSMGLHGQSLVIAALLLSALLLPAHGHGEKRGAAEPTIVSGEGIYYLEGKDNLDYARSMAIQTARADAIGKAFGTAVTSSAHSAFDNAPAGKERNSFSSVMRSLQRGIWVKDITPPEVVSFLDEDSSFGFKATVKGLARPLKSSPIETRGRLLVEGGAPGYPGREAEILKDGEEFFFGFKAASDGWLAIYLTDEEGRVYRVAPTVRSGIGLIPVNADVTVTVRDDYLKNVACITDSAEKEIYNRIVYVFSPTPFTQPLGTDADLRAGLPPIMDYDRFHTWLQDTAVSDEHFTVTWQTIRICR